MDEDLKLTLEQFGLDSRIVRAFKLRKYGQVLTLGELLALGETSVKGTRGIGPKRFKTIVAMLESRGLRLPK